MVLGGKAAKDPSHRLERLGDASAIKHSYHYADEKQQ